MCEIVMISIKEYEELKQIKREYDFSKLTDGLDYSVASCNHKGCHAMVIMREGEMTKQLSDCEKMYSCDICNEVYYCDQHVNDLDLVGVDRICKNCN